MHPNKSEASADGSIATLNDLIFHIREISSGNPELLTVFRQGRRESLSTTDFLRSIHSLAVALQSRGLAPGERVALFSENRPEWHVVDFACHLIGSPTVPIFAGLNPSQVAYILRNSGARWVFFSDVTKRDQLLGLEASLTQIPEMVAFDADAASSEGKTLTRLMGEGAGHLPEVPLERFRGRVSPEDLAGILYTSGTTGNPKGVMLSHGNFVSNMLSCSRLFDLGPDDRAASFLPLSHVFQRTVDHLCFYRGVRIHYIPGADDVLGILAEERPTVLVAAPDLYDRVRDSELHRVAQRAPWLQKLYRWALGVGQRHAVAGRDGFIGPILALQRWIAHRWPLRPIRELFGGALRFAVSGGAPLAEKTAELFESVGIPLYQGYGLTETSPVLATNSPENQRIGSVGKPLSDVEMRIAEDGEILVRGPGIMQGYWQNPGATEASINESGWFRTGDLGRMDKSGYVFVTDRKRDLLTLSTGEQVAPRPIEALLVEPPVAQAVVVGDGRPFPAALLVVDFEAKESSERSALEVLIEERIQRVNLQLPQSIRLRKWTLLDRRLTVEDGDLTPTLKLRRRNIRQAFAAEISELYKGD